MKVIEDGEANRYGIRTDDGRDWAALVQLNGEFTLETQRDIMAAIAEACQKHAQKLTSQGRQ
jgi:hypothetical protein